MIKQFAAIVATVLLTVGAAMTVAVMHPDDPRPNQTTLPTAVCVLPTGELADAKPAIAPRRRTTYCPVGQWTAVELGAEAR